MSEPIKNKAKKKVYFDVTENNDCVSIYMRDAEVIQAGTTIYSMSVKHKNSEYQRYAEEYDIHFIFDDKLPNIDFYSVPRFDVLAVDSEGGFIGTVGKQSDLESAAPICYIDKAKKCFLIANSGIQFLEKVSEWKRCLTPYEDIVLYDSKADAERELEFIEVSE